MTSTLRAVAETTARPTLPQFSIAGFLPLPESPRKVLNFGPGWRFLRGEAKGAEQPGFDDAQWEAVNLPRGLEITSENASGMRNYQGAAWWRKKFKTPAGSDGQILTLYFEAVMGKSQVWVNGQKVAVHFGGYLPFAAEIGTLLRKDGGDNVVAVRADNADDPTYPPGKPQGELDFTYLGGIYRDVFLIQTNPVHITLPELSQTVAGGGVFVVTKDVNGMDASLEVRTEIANTSAVSRTLTVRTVLEDAAGKPVLKLEPAVTVAAGSAASVTIPMEAKNVHLWHPDDPYLHYLRTEIVADGQVLDSFVTRFGIRLFEMRAQDGLFVNKKYIGHKLSGVNRHQDYAYVGNALPKSGQWRDAKLLREGGSTIVRAAHYPLSPAFYDACDELGLLATTANPGWQFFNAKNPIFAQRLYEDTRALVRRDRNRPSILLWETALNETTDQPQEVLQKMHAAAHEEFPYPGLFTVTDGTEGKLGGFDVWYHAQFNSGKNSFTREYGDGGEVENFYSQNAMTRVKRDWGEQGMLNQAMVRARDLDGMFGTPPIRLGGAIWCGIDHQRGYHPDPFWGGLLDVYRMPRYSYYLFKSQYDADLKLPGISTGPMIFICHELTQVSPADVVIFTNCQEVRLTWLGKEIGVAQPKAEWKHVPHAPVIFKNVFDFHAISSNWRNKTSKIEMVAEGLIDGQVVCREVKKYPERTTGVKLRVDDVGISLAADGSDVVPIRANIVDNKGILKVLATEDVEFAVEGPGEIITGPTGNTARTVFGTATALLRAHPQAGTIRIKATVRGLKSDTLTLQSFPSPLSLLFDAAYAAGGTRGQAPGLAIPSVTASSEPVDVSKLKDEIRRLQLEVTSKEQDLMELRSKLQK